MGRFAGSTDGLLVHVVDNFSLARSELQRLGYVLTNLAQSTVVAAWAGGRHRLDKVPRQMLRQRPAGWLAALERWYRNLLGCHLRRGLGLRGVLVPVGEL